MSKVLTYARIYSTRKHVRIRLSPIETDAFLNLGHVEQNSVHSYAGSFSAVILDFTEV